MVVEKSASQEKVHTNKHKHQTYNKLITPKMSIEKRYERLEKIRFERLELVCRKAIEQSIKKSLSLELLQTCYPDMATTDEGRYAITNARQQIIRFWHTESMREFELIFKERDVEQKLNELDEIIQTAQFRKASKKESPLNIAKLDSDEIIQSTLLTHSTESIENLNMIYNELSLDNAALYEELKGLSNTGKELKLDIEDVLSGLNKQIQTLDNESERLQLNELINSFVSEY